jgi:hypothetical protein
MAKMATLTLDMVKQLVQENESIIINETAFKMSPLAKAIKKKAIEPEALIYIMGNSETWFLREYCYKYCGYSYQEAALHGLLEFVEKEGEWGEMSSYMTEFFTSTEEFLDFVKTNYDIDLAADMVIDTDNKDYTDFRSFAYGILFSSISMQFLDPKRCPKAELYREFYYNAFKPLMRMCEYYQNTGGRSNNFKFALETMSGRVWAVNPQALAELFEENNLNETDRMRYSMEYVKKGFCNNNKRLGAFRSKEEFFQMLKDLKASIPHSFPLAPFSVDCDTQDAIRYFCYGLFNHILGKEGAGEHSIEDRDFFYDLVVEDNLNPERRNNLRANMHYERYFVAAAYNVTPKEKMLDVCEHFMQTFGKADALYGVTKAAECNHNFYPSVAVAELLLKNSTSYFNWNDIIMPEEHLYDMEYIDKMTARLGSSGVLFGSSYNSNQFMVNRIDPGKLPKEFFEKYDKNRWLKWDNLSYCKNMSVEFMKEHKEKIYFYNLNPKTCYAIDDELGKWILAQQNEDEDRFYAYQRALKYSKSLSLDFIAENIEGVWDINYRRALTAARVDVKLADLVGRLK